MAPQGFFGLRRDSTPKMEDHMDKKMENYMETGII